MKFGSWTFTGDQVSLTLYNNKDYVDLSDYWKSGTWDIIEVCRKLDRLYSSELMLFFAAAVAVVVVTAHCYILILVFPFRSLRS